MVVRASAFARPTQRTGIEPVHVPSQTVLVVPDGNALTEHFSLVQPMDLRGESGVLSISTLA